ncbi:MAG: hypothetical protein KF798_01145 [Candidatus Paracaedibacteraceae bacterium]|nr:hypothetical protein [Candidatus Paracaedibacteraceae bacterium]
MLRGLLFAILTHFSVAMETPLREVIQEFSQSSTSEFEVWHQNVTLYDAENLATAIESKKKLSKFSMPFCQLTDTTSLPILAALSQRHDLQVIDFRYNELCQNATEFLALITLNNPEIRIFNVAGNFLAIDSFAEVISNLRLNSNLQSLDLHGIPLSKQTVKILITTLPTLSGLKDVNLMLTQLQSELRSPLLRELAELKKLEALYLGYENWLGLGEQIATVIEKCPTFKKIDLRQCHLYQEDLDRIQQASKYSTQKPWFSFHQNEKPNVNVSV